jgi:hypothetical protein
VKRPVPYWLQLLCSGLLVLAVIYGLVILTGLIPVGRHGG